MKTKTTKSVNGKHVYLFTVREKLYTKISAKQPPFLYTQSMSTNKSIKSRISNLGTYKGKRTLKEN